MNCSPTQTRHRLLSHSKSGQKYAKNINTKWAELERKPVYLNFSCQYHIISDKGMNCSPTQTRHRLLSHSKSGQKYAINIKHQTDLGTISNLPWSSIGTLGHRKRFIINIITTNHSVTNCYRRKTRLAAGGLFQGHHIFTIGDQTDCCLILKESQLIYLFPAFGLSLSYNMRRGDELQPYSNQTSPAFPQQKWTKVRQKYKHQMG